MALEKASRRAKARAIRRTIAHAKMVILGPIRGLMLGLIAPLIDPVTKRAAVCRPGLQRAA